MLLFIYLCIFIVMLLTIKTKYHLLFKTINSLAFIAIAIYCAVYSQQIQYLYVLMPGLICCLAGDVFLAVKNQKSFIYGVIAFMLGHLCFLFYFSNFMGLAVEELIIPVFSTIVFIALSYLPKMDYRGLDKLVGFYSFVVAWSMSKSILIYFSFLTPMFFYSMIGFILFFISDFVLLFIKFYDQDIKYLRALNLLLYYSGMFFIAYSLC